MAFWRRLAAALAAGVLVAGLAAAQEGRPGVADPGERIRELEETVRALSRQLEAVRAELAALKRRQEEAERQAEVERMRREALGEAGGTTAETGAEAGGGFVSGTRMQPQLNPEISVTGDVVLSGGTGREEMRVRSLELDLRSALDPYSELRVVLGYHSGGEHLAHGEEHGGDGGGHGGGAEVEEAYVRWLHLPGGLTLAAGKKRQRFGTLNRWHLHALDQVDLPWVLQESFGEEGLSGTGLSADWLLPGVWSDATELTVEVTGGDNEVAFAGEDWEHPAVLARLGSYWDLTEGSYLELGFDALRGSADADGRLRHRFYAVDLAWDWQPPGRERSRGATVRGMVLRSELDLPGGGERSAWGGFLYGQFKFSPRWIAGLRYDRVDDQLEAGHRYWGLSPYVTFWQSEFVRLRGQASYRKDNRLGIDRRLELQVTFAAGPHKHETY